MTKCAEHCRASPLTIATVQKTAQVSGIPSHWLARLPSLQGHYNYYRDYDPSLGRYAESDPIGLRGGINTYGYAGAQPISAIDPLGQDVKWKGTIIGGGATPGLGGQFLRFELTSECKCNRIVTITGFASFVSAGVGAKLPLVRDFSGSGGEVELSTIFDCPNADDANGPASMFGMNFITPIGGASFMSRTKLGRLSTGFHGADGLSSALMSPRQ